MPPWIAAAVQKLVESASEGCSAGEIANSLGVTRNAVIGKLHRLGMRTKRHAIPAKPRHVSPQRRHGIAQPPAPKPLPVFEATEPPTPECSVTITDLEPHHCRWPVAGEGHETRYCGDRKWSEMYPYCAHHHHRAHHPAGR